MGGPQSASIPAQSSTSSTSSIAADSPDPKCRSIVTRPLYADESPKKLVRRSSAADILHYDLEVADLEAPEDTLARPTRNLAGGGVESRGSTTNEVLKDARRTCSGPYRGHPNDAHRAQKCRPEAKRVTEGVQPQMTEGTEGRHRHFILEGVTETEAYIPAATREASTGARAGSRQHGGELQRQINELREKADSVREVQRDAGIEDGPGLQVEFESFPDVELAFESLARERSGIELLNVRHEENRTATVFVDGKLNHFERLIRDYFALVVPAITGD